MIQKIQTLQKRLIAKTEEIVEKDMVIRAKEQLYQDVKNILRLQPGPEVAVEKNVLEHNLKEKKRQMKAMASELNMLQAQVNEYKVRPLSHDYSFTNSSECTIYHSSSWSRKIGKSKERNGSCTFNGEKINCSSLRVENVRRPHGPSAFHCFAITPHDHSNLALLLRK